MSTYREEMTTLFSVGLFTGVSGLVVAMLGAHTFLKKRLGGGLMLVAGVAVASFAGFTVVIDPLAVFS